MNLNILPKTTRPAFVSIHRAVVDSREFLIYSETPGPDQLAWAVDWVHVPGADPRQLQTLADMVNSGEISFNDAKWRAIALAAALRRTH